MKLFKKITAGFISLMLCTASDLPAKATTICGDVNNDGTIGITDISMLSLYINGSYTGINLSNADVDRNAVIDIDDITVLRQYIYHSISSLPYNESSTMLNNITYNLPSDESRAYRKYKKNTNSNTWNVSRYTLASTALNTASLLLDEDDRQLDTNAVSDDVRAIVSLKYTGSDGVSAQGTGFIINDHVIATAAHCVLDYEDERIHSDLSITIFGNNGASMINMYHPTEVHVPFDYIRSNLYASPNDRPICDYDYALIYVSEDLSNYGKINMGLTTDYFNSTSTEIGVSGFPIQINGSPINPNRYYGTGNIIPVGNLSNYNSKFLYSDVYTSSGDSGGPMYIQYTSNGSTFRSAIGVFSCVDDNNTPYDPSDDMSKAVRITKPVLKFYTNNPRIGEWSVWDEY